MANSADAIPRPIVGIVCVDIASSLSKHYGVEPASYIAASYVKFMEAAGARVVPIWIGRDRTYYVSMMHLVNGVLLPGGAVYLDDEDKPATDNPRLTNECVKTIEYIYELALERNEAGNCFPIWGICLGFQLMMKNAARQMKRTKCGKIFNALPLELTADYRQSKIFSGLAPELHELLESEPFACHQHKYCITEKSLGAAADDWRVLATRKSANDEIFITLIEHKRFPFYGCQFHPERAAYEKLVERKDPCSKSHTETCIQLNQHFANFFVTVCGQNSNRFANEEQLARHLISNWNPESCGEYGDVNWREVYLFSKDVDYPKAVAN
ncbi:gamma-glutamyl hydrolase isoform X2 [Drosophila hydei]|uniref:folate gamma-glutamyl hydrolase n=1 Tax=Drosophila hydei TaxID=7224 RepID=A0A6J1LY88_DROHY|nr:gamma-glutamyl hydrolase isoform X2 [Drosophila hydei]